MATPDTGHLARPEFAEVYPPAEDSFLLMDALLADRDAIAARRPLICWEIGSVQRADARCAGQGATLNGNGTRARARARGPVLVLYAGARCTERDPGRCWRFSARSSARNGHVRWGCTA